MRHLRLALPALALAASVAGTSQGFACDKDKATASASSAKKAAYTSAAHGTESMSGCATTKTRSAAVTAAHAKSAKGADCCAMKGAATAVAQAKRSPGMMGSVMTTASYEGALPAEAAAVANAGAEDHCGAKGGAATSASTMAVVAGASEKAGGQCSSRGVSGARFSYQADCDACGDMVLCEQELTAAGARTQVVPLRNGVMLVYSATPGKVNAVQQAMARRTERLNQLAASGDKARLCADCRFMRGATASGKLTREVVNLQGGALMLMTSRDPAMVSKIQTLVEGERLARKM